MQETENAERRGSRTTESCRARRRSKEDSPEESARYRGCFGEDESESKDARRIRELFSKCAKAYMLR